MRTISFQVTLLALLMPFRVQAELLLDTLPGGERSCGGIGLAESQFVAVALPTPMDRTITSVEGLIRVGHPGVVRIAVYEDASGPGTLLYSDSLVISETGHAWREHGPAWRELGNLKWSLTPGVYWVALEVHDSPFEGSMDGARGDANQWAYTNATGAWVGMSQPHCIGVRVHAS
jgi:hypothetical protein